MNVESFSEFQPLEEVIVGRAYAPEAFKYSKDPEIADSIGRVLAETEEDIQNLVRLLEGEGVTVHRPQLKFDLGTSGTEPDLFRLQHMQFMFPNHPLMPRDTTFVYGRRLIQTYTRSQNRYLENSGYYDLFRQLWENGADWTSMPTPLIYDKRKTYTDYAEDTLLFHAANMIKCGTKVIHTNPHSSIYPTGKGTDLGLSWFRRQLPEVEFIEAPCGGHIDGKMAILKPGLVMCWNKDHLPEILRGWDVIQVPPKSPFPESFKNIQKQRFYKDYVKRWLTEWIGFVDETVFDVNVFSISESTVVCTGYDADVFTQLEKFGVKPVYWNFRHQYFWDGGVHCLTLDLKRRGGCENYFG